MNRKALVTLFVILLIGIIPTHAQDTTDEAPFVTPTVEAAPDIVEEAPTFVAPDPELTRTGFAAFGEVAVIVIGSVLTGAVSVLGGIWLILRNKTVQRFLEMLFLAQSPQTQQRVRTVAVGVKEVGEIAEQITDGVLDGDVPPPNGTVVR